MPTATGTHRGFSFGAFTLDMERGALLKAGADVRLRPKSFEVLRVLIERHGCLVSKDELLHAVWGSTVVTEGVLTQCVIDVRRALGDTTRQMIRTVPRRGYIFDGPVAESTDPTPASAAKALALQPPSRTVPRALSNWGSAALLVLALSLMVAWWAIAGRPTTAPAAVPSVAAPSNSIAVLPFVDMSPEPDQEYFSEGISEEILIALARVPTLRVIARTSSFSFKGQNIDITTIATRLKVAHVLEGSVRKSGNRVRITAQLVDATNGVPRWSQTYDGELQDALSLQTEIAAGVASALNVTLAQGAENRGPSVSAHEDFLQGRFFFNRRGPGDLERALQHFQEAVRIDPQSARAWAALAGTYGALAGERAAAPADATVRRAEAVQRALALDPNLAEAHVTAAHYYYSIGDEATSAAHREKAMQLEPDNAQVRALYAGAAAWDGRLDEAIEHGRRALLVDPLSAIHRGNLAEALLASGRYEEAEREFRLEAALQSGSQTHEHPSLAMIRILQRRFDEALAMVQSWPEGDARDQALALIHHELGHEALAAEALQRLMSRSELSATVRLSEVYAFRGESAEAFKWLHTANERLRENPINSPDERWIWHRRLSPFLRPLHADARWQSILACDERRGACSQSSAEARVADSSKRNAAH